MNKVKATAMEQMLLQRVEELKMELNEANSIAFRARLQSEDCAPSDEIFDFIQQM